METSTSSSLFALDLELRVGEVAGLESRVDHDLVLARWEPKQLAVREAEAPGAFVVGGPVWDHVRSVGQRVQPLTQFVEWKRRPYRLAVGNDVERGVPAVHDPGTVGVRDVRVAEIPLVRHDPVEHPGAARDLDPPQRNLLLEDVERGPHPVAGEAAAEREQPAHQLVGVVSDGLRSRRLACENRGHASTALRQKKASAYELGELHSMPRRRSRLENRSSWNQRLERWEPKWLIR